MRWGPGLEVPYSLVGWCCQPGGGCSHIQSQAPLPRGPPEPKGLDPSKVPGKLAAEPGPHCLMGSGGVTGAPAL